MYKILENGENQFVEFKLSFQKELIKSIVAFANTKGGKIYIGVSDDCKIKGVEINNVTIQNYINTIKQNTQPSIIVDIDSYNDNSKTILIIDVKEYPLKLIKNSNHIMSLDEISNEHLKTINSSWDYYIDDSHSFNDISQENISNFIEKIERFQNKSFNDDPMTILRKYELLKDDKITFATYLLFTSNHSALTSFQIGRFKTETKIIDSIDINTDILSQIDTAIDFIKRHFMVEYIITGNPQREEKYDYTLEAIHEIVINMILHRDYQDSGNSIIKIFDERIEFFNSGKLHNDLTIEKLYANNYTSRTRNRAIARAFKEAGIIEQYGSGIKRIQEDFKSHGIVKPKFEEFVHGFRVIIYKEKLIDSNEGVKSLHNLIKKNPNKKSPFFSKELQTSVKNIERWIKSLKEQNKIEFKGSPKTGGYYEKR